MSDMFDMFRQAQGGAAFDNLARAYGMSPEQMQAAAAALSPAFAQGFARRTQGDASARRFAQMLNTETYARAFDAQAAALDHSTKAAGDDALGALFGSKDVSRAVAAQAAAASGVQAELIRKVLPVLASILIGGFMKAAQSAGSPAPKPDAPPQPGFPGDFGPIGDFWKQMTGGATAGAAAGQGGGENPQNPFQDWMGGFGKPGATPDAAPSNPLGDAMAETLNTMFGGVPKAEPEAPPAATAPPPEAGTKRTPFDDMADVSAGNAKAMEQIFDAFFGRKG